MKVLHKGEWLDCEDDYDETFREAWRDVKNAKIVETEVNGVLIMELIFGEKKRMGIEILMK